MIVNTMAGGIVHTYTLALSAYEKTFLCPSKQRQGKGEAGMFRR